MKRKLYINNLSKETDEAELKSLFSIAGRVTWVAIARGRYSNLSRGFALIEMENEDSARRALEKFDGFRLQGNIINVSKNKNNKAWSN